MNPEILVFFDELSQKFSPKDDVYQYAKQWLSYLGGQTIDIASNADISAIGIYCFWAGHLGLTNNKIIINNPELIKIANNTNTSIEGKHPIKYTLYFHKIENSISTLVKS